MTKPKSNFYYLLLSVKVTSNRKALLDSFISLMASDFLVYPLTNDVKMMKLSNVLSSLMVAISSRDNLATMYSSYGSFCTFISKMA